MYIPSIKTLFTIKYIKSFIYGYLNRKTFIHVKYFCFFIGYARSGHSFIASLLDAHPECCMSLEINALKLVEEGYGKNQLYYVILNNSRAIHQRLNNVWTGYSYAVNGQYQGRFTDIKVIGDKQGSKTTLRLGENFTLCRKLKKIVEVPVKAIHVIRDPLDNITTMILRNISADRKPVREDFRNKIDLYFKKVDINNKIKESGEIEIIDIYHEDFIKDPVKELKKILEFLELEPYPDYITACSKIVYKEPHLSRYQLVWPHDLQSEIQNKTMEYPFLSRYSENKY